MTSSMLCVVGMYGSTSITGRWYLLSGVALRSSIEITQVSLSRRIPRPMPCITLICICGTTTAPIKSRRLMYWLFCASLNSVFCGKGSLYRMREDTISPGKSKPSHARPQASSTPLPERRKAVRLCSSLRLRANSG